MGIGNKCLFLKYEVCFNPWCLQNSDHSCTSWCLRVCWCEFFTFWYMIVILCCWSFGLLLRSLLLEKLCYNSGVLTATSLIVWFSVSWWMLLPWMENASSMQPAGLTNSQAEPKAFSLLSCFDPITSPLVGSVLVLTVLLVQPKVKDNCLWSSGWDGMCFCSKHPHPRPQAKLWIWCTFQSMC